MPRDASKSMEGWWASESLENCPGSSALLVGAGISIQAPTCLPNGIALTEALLDHLLSDDAAAEIKAVFAQCAPLIGRALPRLEHVLGQACNPLPHEAFSRPNNPRNVLGLFRDKLPNVNHHLIARHLLEKRGWCITTNFDDCIERASSFSIPVHVLDSEHNRIAVRHGGGDDDWGLVKLHGTIEDGVDGLWATLADLQFGLPEPMRRLLERIMGSVDMLVVAGYSGTDHFDVNQWIREGMGNTRRRHAPKLVWISHSANTPATWHYDDKSEPFLSWSSAFDGTRCLLGATTGLLSELTGIPAPAMPDMTGDERPLPDRLAELYRPSREEIHLSSARLAASIGLGQRAEEELRKMRHCLGDAQACASIEPGIYFARGMAREALTMHKLLDTAAGGERITARMRILRRSRTRFATIRRLFLLLKASRSGLDRDETAVDALECVLDVAQDIQRFAVFRTRPLRRLTAVLVGGLSHPGHRPREDMRIDLRARLQTQALRRQALFMDDDECQPLLTTLWRLVHEQYSPPDFYTDSGPLIPGYFLIEQSTAREEDRLADLVEVNLELASVLLIALRRRWPGGIDDVDRESRRKKRSWSRAEFDTGQYAVTVLCDLLFDATRIATALNEHALQVRIATCWLHAEEILGGVAYWKRQRLYLPSFPLASR